MLQYISHISQISQGPLFLGQFINHHIGAQVEDLDFQGKKFRGAITKNPIHADKQKIIRPLLWLHCATPINFAFEPPETTTEVLPWGGDLTKGILVATLGATGSTDTPGGGGLRATRRRCGLEGVGAGLSSGGFGAAIGGGKGTVELIGGRGATPVGTRIALTPCVGKDVKKICIRAPIYRTKMYFIDNCHVCRYVLIHFFCPGIKISVQSCTTFSK